MSTQPPAAPQPPAKPIPTKKWGLVLLFGVIGLLILLDLATSIHLTHQSPKQANRSHAAAGASVARDFDADATSQLNTIRKGKENLQNLIDKVGSVDWSRVNPSVPECNQATRDRLNGKYFVTATSDGTAVRLSCEANDQWAVIPAAAASIEPMTPEQQAAYQRQQSYGQQQSNGQTLAEQRRQERERKRMEALNSSSVALDFSGKQTAGSLQQTPLQQAGWTEPTPAAQPAPEAEKPKYPWDNYSGQLYRVFEGSVVETVLTNRLNGEFTGPVNAMVATNVYSHDHQHILIPQGTRILGEALKVNVQNQRRLAVVFHRAIMPDGFSIDFDKFQGLDQQGATGLTGKVDTHWLKVIGTAILVGAIAGLSEFGGFTNTNGPGVVLETGIGAQTGQQATQILNRAMNVLPSVTVFEGTRVRIWATRDFEVPAYENHLVSPSL